MPQTPHIEKHFTGSQTIRDLVIGMADGVILGKGTVKIKVLPGALWVIAPAGHFPALPTNEFWGSHQR